MNPNKKKLSDYIFIFYKWRSLFISTILFFIIIGFLFAFLIPNQYRATARITLPPESGLGGLASFIGGDNSSIASFGAKLFGLSSSNEDLLLGLLYSRTSLENTIRKFNLTGYYEIKDNNIDKTIKAFRGDISFEPNEYGLIEISVTNKDPKISAEIANYFVKLLDSLNNKLNTTQARNNRSFIGKRYEQNISDLKTAEDSMYRFQKKYGIVAVPEQLETAVKAAAEIEAELTEAELKASLVKNQMGSHSPLYISLKNEAELLRKKVDELKYSNNLSSASNIMFPFKEMPYLSLKYLRYYREIEIQQNILEVLLPLYEQAKVEEQKSIPTILVVDRAEPPQLKDSPKRSFIILLFFFLGLFLLIPLILIGDRVLKEEEKNNTIEKFQYNFFDRIKRIFHIKI